MGKKCNECERWEVGDKRCERCGESLVRCALCNPRRLCRLCEEMGFLSLSRAAIYLHETGVTGSPVHPQTLRRWIARGLLHCERWGRGPGGAMKLKRADLDAFEPPTPGARTGPRPR
jgi:hypothetical protein